MVYPHNQPLLAHACRSSAKPRRARAGCISLLIATMAIGLLSGCSELDVRKNIPWVEGKDEKYDEPAKVVVMWADAMLNQSEKKGVRGFGGRLYFYGKNPSKPIKVKGTLVIYAFDESSRSPENVVPDKKYVFTPEQLEKHYSKNDVGASYSVWLPWDEIGGIKKEVSLIARFTSEKGNLVISEATKQDLPGMPTSADLTALKAQAIGGASAPQTVPPTPMLNPGPQYPGVETAYQQPAGGTDGAMRSAPGGQPSMAAILPGASSVPGGATGVFPDGSPVPAGPMHNTTTFAMPMNRLARSNGMSAGQAMNAANQPALNQPGANQQPTMNPPRRTTIPQAAVGNSPGVNAVPLFNGANLPPATGGVSGATSGMSTATTPAGPAVTTWGVVPSPGFANGPGRNATAAGFPATAPNASGFAVPNTAGFPRNAGMAGTPTGWNARAPWNANSNPAGMLDGSNGTPNGNGATTAAMTASALQSGAASGAAGWPNGPAAFNAPNSFNSPTAFNAMNPNRQGQATPVQASNSF